MVHVRRVIGRPPLEVVEAFRGLASATIHEASGRKGAVEYGIKPAAAEMRICGPALTVQCVPGDNLMLHKALQVARPGDVIVATVAGEWGFGYWGGLMSVSAMAKGVGGLAIDGCIRDSREIIQMGFPVFCRGFAIRGTNKESLGLINYPTVFGGVTVAPGDLIVGDDDGIVVVKLSECGQVLEKAMKRVKSEEEKASVLRTGVSSVELNGLDKVFADLGLVEE